MYFEHIVVVNDPNHPVPPLSRVQLWRGLRRRAYSPLEFIEAADDCTIVEQGENWLLREIHFGQMSVRDRIEFLPQQAVHYHTEANEQHAGGKVSMVIEEPQAGVMCVRFVYQTPLPEQSPEEKHYASYVKKAYQQMDIESIRIIRELAEQGELNELH